jgi:hypothetical protein
MVWGVTAFGCSKRLRFVQNKCLKIISKLPQIAATKSSHRDMQIDTIQEYIKLVPMKMHAGFPDHLIPTLSQTGQYDPLTVK